MRAQVVVEKMLMREEGKTRHDYGREDFLKRVWVRAAPRLRITHAADPGAGACHAHFHRSGRPSMGPASQANCGACVLSRAVHRVDPGAERVWFPRAGAWVCPSTGRARSSRWTISCLVRNAAPVRTPPLSALLGVTL